MVSLTLRVGEEGQKRGIPAVLREVLREPPRLPHPTVGSRNSGIGSRRKLIASRLPTPDFLLPIKHFADLDYRQQGNARPGPGAAPRGAPRSATPLPKRRRH